MDFRLSDEQQMLRDSARRCLSELAKTMPSPKRWRHFADLGWTAMAVPEAAGGLGSSIADLAVLAEEFGRALEPESLVAGAMLPAAVLGMAGAGAGSLLSEIATGETRAALAVYEPQRRYSLQPALRATQQSESSFCLEGRKLLVVSGAQADRLVVSASLARAGAAQEPALFVVDATARGLGRTAYETLDGRACADFEFDGVVATDLLLCGASVPALVEDALDRAVISQCAELVGGMDRCIELTVEHLKTRRQFGRPLADLQALQHAVAELFMDAYAARSILYRAIGSADASRAERQQAVSGCKIKVVECATRVAGAAVHLHGGIGVSTEYAVGHYLRRAIVAERLYGDLEHHLKRRLEPGGVA